MMQHTAKSQAVSNPGSIRYHDDGTTELAGNVPPAMVVGELIHQLGVFLATLEVCERGADGGYVLRAPGTSLHRGLGETWRRVLQLVGALIGGSIDLERLKKLSDSEIAWSNVEARRSDLPLSDLLQVLTWSILHGPSGVFVTTLPAATVDRIRGVKHALAVYTTAEIPTEMALGAARKLGLPGAAYPHASSEVPSPKIPSEADLQSDAAISAKELAEKFDLPLHALEKRLSRYRKNNGDGFVEVSNRSVRQAQYLYKINSIAPIIRSLAKKTQCR